MRMKTTETRNLYGMEVVRQILSKEFGKKIFSTDLSIGCDNITTTYWDERIMSYLQNSEFTLETRYEDEKHTVKLQRADSKVVSWYATIETYHKGKLVNTDYVARMCVQLDCTGSYATECFYVASYGYKKYSLFRKAKRLNKGYLSSFTSSNFSIGGEYVTYFDDEIDSRLKFIDERIERKYTNGNIEVREAYSFDVFMRVINTVNTPSVLLLNTVNDIMWKRYQADNPTNEFFDSASA